jgi:hypothetical protein
MISGREKIIKITEKLLQNSRSCFSREIITEDSSEREQVSMIVIPSVTVKKKIDHYIQTNIIISTNETAYETDKNFTKKS